MPDKDDTARDLVQRAHAEEIIPSVDVEAGLRDVIARARALEPAAPPLPVVPFDPPAYPQPNPKVAALFESHYPAMTRLAFLLGADDPENIASEAFYQLCRNWRRVHKTDAVLSYLRSVVCNLTRKRIRRLGLERNWTVRFRGDPTTAPSVEIDVALKDDQRAVRKALNELPGRQREVLVLRYWGDLSETEIAATLGIAPGTVKTHASRGMTRLERTLESA